MKNMAAQIKLTNFLYLSAFFFFFFFVVRCGKVFVVFQHFRPLLIISHVAYDVNNWREKLIVFVMSVANTLKFTYRIGWDAFKWLLSFQVLISNAIRKIVLCVSAGNSGVVLLIASRVYIVFIHYCSIAHIERFSFHLFGLRSKRSTCFL